MKLTRSDIDRKVAQAASSLLARAPNNRVTPELMMQIADEHQLPIGTSVENDVVARTIFVAAFAPEAKAIVGRGCDLVWQRFEQLAQLANAAQAAKSVM